MGNAGGVVGADEKHQITGLGLLRCDGGTEVIKPLRRLPPDAPSAVIEYPANKAGTTTTYDTAVINNNSTSGLMYVSIRYNK